MKIKFKIALPEVQLILLCTVITSSMMLLKVSVLTVFLALQLLLIAIHIYNTGGIKVTNDKLVNFIFLELIISTICCLTSSISLSYKKAALISTCLVIPMYFFFSLIKGNTRQRAELLCCVKKGIKITCIVELIWCFLQFVAYKFAGLDINQKIFVNLLHLVQTASRYESGKFFRPSGLCWHQSLMAPIVVLTFFFSGSIIWIGLALLDSLICHSTTAFIGILCCFIFTYGLKAIKYIQSGRVKIHKIVAFFAAILFVLAIPVAIKANAPAAFAEELMRLVTRITHSSSDLSSAAHMRYYTSYKDVVKMSSPLQVFFGYGYGCSGYPITKLFDQYAYLNNWSVESDVMNILISRGILGFFGYYGMLAYIAIKGYRIDERYALLIACIVVEGVTYNIQFDWLFFLELFLYLAVQSRFNIFTGEWADPLQMPIAQQGD